jgi:hypothetical protein
MKLKKSIELRTKAEARIEAIRADADLSVKKKGEMIAGERERTNNAIVALREAHNADRAAQHESLKRQLFGLSHRASATEADKHAAITSFRDAQFRVQDLESKAEGQRNLRRARMAGDSLLARAVGALAYENGWGDLLNEYAAGAGSQSVLEELGALEQSEGDRTRQFETAVAFTQIPETSEERNFRIASGPTILGAAVGSQDSQLRG